MKNTFTLLALICAISISYAQTKNVLFLGNSYTGMNDLPQMIYDLGIGNRDTLVFNSNTPGGNTLQMHSNNSISLNLIAQGNWDFVVLQEQSQLPSLSDAIVEADVYPYARILDSLITAANKCTETIFYMTWGRKFGDSTYCPSWPPVCTYEGMDSLLFLRYMTMASDNEAVVAPVGALWKYLNQNTAIELYTADHSHPTVAGTYAAACAFYSIIFRKDPSLLSFNSTLSPAVADTIRNAAKLVVFGDFSQWKVEKYDPAASFSYADTALTLSFSNYSAYSTSYQWDFGDGDTSSLEHPTHTYANPGLYTVRLVASACGMSDTTEQIINLLSSASPSLEGFSAIKLFPNPTNGLFSIQLKELSWIDSPYSLTDVFGRVLLRGTLKSEMNSLDISALAKGTYFLRIGDGQEQLKLVKN